MAAFGPRCIESRRLAARVFAEIEALDHLLQRPETQRTHRRHFRTGIARQLFKRAARTSVHVRAERRETFRADPRIVNRMTEVVDELDGDITLRVVVHDLQSWSAIDVAPLLEAVVHHG